AHEIQKRFQTREVFLEVGRQLKQEGRPPAFQLCDHPQKTLRLAADLLQSPAVRNRLRCLESESEIVRYLLRPGPEDARFRHAVERAVDLDRGKMPGVVAQHFVWAQAFGIELPFPFLVTVAARSHEELHQVLDSGVCVSAKPWRSRSISRGR